MYAGVRKIASTPCQPSLSEQKRAAILTAAVDVFLRGGYEAAGMDAIATEAGVAKQTIYNHFGSKDGLFRAIVSGLTDELLSFLPPRGAPREVLRVLGMQFLTVMFRPSSLALHRMLVGDAHRFPTPARAPHAADPRPTDPTRPAGPQP